MFSSIPIKNIISVKHIKHSSLFVLYYLSNKYYYSILWNSIKQTFSWDTLLWKIREDNWYNNVSFLRFPQFNKAISSNSKKNYQASCSLINLEKSAILKCILLYQIHLLSWKQSINWDRRVSAKLTQINRRKEKNYKYSISIIDNNENVKQNPLKSNKNKCFNYITSLIVRAFSMNHSNFLRSSFSPKLCFQTNWPWWENWNLVFCLNR